MRAMLRRLAAPLVMSACLTTTVSGACGGETPTAAAPEAAAPAKSEPEAPAEPPKTPPGVPAARPEHPEAATVCRSALACAADCFRQAGAPAQSLPECQQPRSPECIAALKAAQPAPLEMTMAGLRCALPCEKEHHSLPDLQGVVPEQWAKLALTERAAWTGIIAGRDCVPGSACEAICDADYPPPETVIKRGMQAAADAEAKAERDAAAN